MSPSQQFQSHPFARAADLQGLGLKAWIAKAETQRHIEGKDYPLSAYIARQVWIEIRDACDLGSVEEIRRTPSQLLAAGRLISPDRPLTLEDFFGFWLGEHR